MVSDDVSELPGECSSSGFVKELAFRTEVTIEIPEVPDGRLPAQNQLLIFLFPPHATLLLPEHSLFSVFFVFLFSVGVEYCSDSSSRKNPDRIR